MKLIHKICASALLLTSLLAGCAATSHSKSTTAVIPTQDGLTNAPTVKAPEHTLSEEQRKNTIQYIRYMHFGPMIKQTLEKVIPARLSFEITNQKQRTCVLKKISEDMGTSFSTSLENSIEDDLTSGFNHVVGDKIINALDAFTQNNKAWVSAHLYATIHNNDAFTDPKTMETLSKTTLTPEQKLIALLPQNPAPFQKEFALLMDKKLSQNEKKQAIAGIKQMYKKTQCNAECLERKMMKHGIVLLTRMEYIITTQARALLKKTQEYKTQCANGAT
jgi:hypothetical protein